MYKSTNHHDRHILLAIYVRPSIFTCHLAQKRVRYVCTADPVYPVIKTAVNHQFRKICDFSYGTVFLDIVKVATFYFCILKTELFVALNKTNKRFPSSKSKSLLLGRHSSMPFLSFRLRKRIKNSQSCSEIDLHCLSVVCFCMQNSLQVK